MLNHPACLVALNSGHTLDLMRQARRAAAVVAAVQRSLQDEGAALAMRVELARMQRASSAAGNNLRVPTLDQLLAAAAVQELQCLTHLAAANGSLPTEVWQLFGQWEDLALESAATQPHHPFLARCPELRPTRRCQTHGVAIARQRQSDWWTARLAHQLAVLATANQVAAVPPAEAAGLLAEADAAYRHCHAVLP